MEPETESGEPSQPAGAIDRTIGAFIRGLIAAGYSPRTVKASHIDLRQFSAFLASRGVDSLAAIRRADVSAFAAILAEPAWGRAQDKSAAAAVIRPCARSTVARKLSVIRNFLRFCEDDGLIEASPAAGVASPKMPKRLPQVLTPDQTALLLESIGGAKPLALRDRALFELLYSSGLRCQEVLDLKLRDISHESCEVRVKGKGAQGARCACG